MPRGSDTWQSCRVDSGRDKDASALLYTRMLLAAVVLQMSFTDLPLPLGARVPDGAFGRSSSRAHRSLLMRSRLDMPLKQQVMDLHLLNGVGIYNCSTV